MTVTAIPRDTHGTLLQSKITELGNSIVSSSLTKAAVAAQLDQQQRELVNHFMSNGRLLASTILSTMT